MIRGQKVCVRQMSSLQTQEVDAGLGRRRGTARRFRTDGRVRVPRPRLREPRRFHLALPFFFFFFSRHFRELPQLHVICTQARWRAATVLSTTSHPMPRLAAAPSARVHGGWGHPAPSLSLSSHRCVTFGRGAGALQHVMSHHLVLPSGFWFGRKKA